MAQRKATTEDVQLDLIDVGPANAKAMKPVVQKYNAALAERLSWLDEENEQKKKLLEMVKEAGLQPNADRVIQFSIDGTIIKITPRDELISVKPPKGETATDAKETEDAGER